MAFAIPASAKTVTVPIHVDYPLLQQLLITQLFNTPERSMEILHDPARCSRIALSNPSFSSQQSKLKIDTDVRAALGVELLGKCSKLVYWEGHASFLGQPVISASGTAVKIVVLDSKLISRDGEIITSGKIWAYVKDRLQLLLDPFTLDLSASINALDTLLPEILPQHSAQQLQAITTSLKLTDIRVADTGLDADVSFQIAQLIRPAPSEAPLSEQELQRWQRNWQMMDALLTNTVKHYAAATDLQELRQALLNILLDARYGLQQALTEPVRRSDDPVRHWFIDSWERLVPVIRKISRAEPGNEPLLFISLITAGNALHALDQLGPAFGLDISANGLRRMARLLQLPPGIDPLYYDEAVDPQLRRLMQLPALPLRHDEPTGLKINFWLITAVRAETSSERLERWAPGKNNLHTYLPLVHALLIRTANGTAKQTMLSADVQQLYRKLVLATAWQESCWRQYVIAHRKIVPLRSSSGDVGLMQLNEHVWRGFYDIHKLRWEIAYNAHAGAEVLLNYLHNYALKRGEHKKPGGLDNLARAAYSAYNGGPGQVSRYRNPRTASPQKKIDAAFWHKFKAVKHGQEMQVAQCLGASEKVLSALQPEPKIQHRSGSDKSGGAGTERTSKALLKKAGKGWVQAQNPRHYTLQLAVFSSVRSAEKFIASARRLQGVIAIYTFRKKRRSYYSVLYNSYSKRSDAERAGRTLQRYNPWVRQFAALTK